MTDIKNSMAKFQIKNLVCFVIFNTIKTVVNRAIQTSIRIFFMLEAEKMRIESATVVRTTKPFSPMYLNKDGFSQS